MPNMSKDRFDDLAGGAQRREELPAGGKQMGEDTLMGGEERGLDTLAAARRRLARISCMAVVNGPLFRPLHLHLDGLVDSMLRAQITGRA